MKHIRNRSIAQAKQDIFKGNFERALEGLMRASRKIENLENEFELWKCKDDLFYWHFVAHQLLGNTEDSLTYLLWSFAEELLEKKIRVEQRRTRGQDVLQKFFGAERSFLVDFSNSVYEYRNNPLALRFMDFISPFRDRYSPKIKINMQTHRIQLTREETSRANEIDELLDRKRTIDTTGDFLTFYKRWNSIYPEYPSSIPLFNNQEEEVLGGGYFLVSHMNGLIIDPGYGFLKQFFRDRRNFGFEDISMIIVTHAHDDHTHEIESIYSLDSKWKKRHGNTRTIPFIGSEGTVIKYSRLLTHNDCTAITMTTGKVSSFRHQDSIGTILQEKRIRLTWKSTIHNERPWMDSNTGVALRFEIDYSQRKEPFVLGITGDGKADTREQMSLLSNFLKGSDLLVVHVGDRVGDRNHIGIQKAGELIGKTSPKVAILTEFGKEFEPNDGRKNTEDDIWIFAHAENSSHIPTILAADSGLTVRIPDLHIFAEGRAGNSWIPHDRVRSLERAGNTRQVNEGQKIFYREI